MRSEKLGTARELDLPQGTIRFWERGEGRPVVFVHGLLVNANLWRNVVPAVAGSGLRCIAPDWPLGAHTMPMSPFADLTPPGIATLIDDALAALDLDDVTLVANDTGGALVQILMSRRPKRVSRVVLTSCDSYERFFPPMFNYLPTLAAVPGSTWLLAQAMRPRALHRLPVTFGWLSKRPLPREIVDSYLDPMRQDPAIRRDLRAFLRGVHRRHTLAAAETFGGFDRPVLLAWAADDRLFPLSLARRLDAALPGARLVTVPDSYTFVPEDQPDRLAELIAEFTAA